MGNHFSPRRCRGRRLVDLRVQVVEVALLVIALRLRLRHLLVAESLRNLFSTVFRECNTNAIGRVAQGENATTDFAQDRTYDHSQ